MTEALDEFYKRKWAVAESALQAAQIDLNKLDAVVRVLGIEDSHDEPADVIRAIKGDLQAALAREAGLREALGNIIRERANAEWPLNVRADNMATIAGQALAALDGDGSEVLAVMNAAWRLHGFDRLLKQFGPSHDGAVERDMATARDDLCKALDKLQEKRDG